MRSWYFIRRIFAVIYLLYLETFYSNSKLLDLFFQPENNTESGNKATCVTDLVGNVKNEAKP